MGYVANFCDGRTHDRVAPVSQGQIAVFAVMPESRAKPPLTREFCVAIQVIASTKHGLIACLIPCVLRVTTWTISRVTVAAPTTRVLAQLAVAFAACLYAFWFT